MIDHFLTAVRQGAQIRFEPEQRGNRLSECMCTRGRSSLVWGCDCFCSLALSTHSQLSREPIIASPSAGIDHPDIACMYLSTFFYSPLRTNKSPPI